MTTLSGPGRPGTPAAPGPRPGGTFRPDPAAAPALRRVLAQGRFDARLLLGNGEQVLLTLILPALLLVGLAGTRSPSLGPGRRIDLATAGVLALAVLSTSFTGQAISTGFDRRYGVLRLLGTTPLGRTGLIAGRVLAVLALQLVQLVVLGGLALALGWHPRPAGIPAAVAGWLLGTAAFVALGLLLAGTLRAEAVLAAANLIWVLLLTAGGVVLPPDRMGGFAAVARLLPSGALGDVLRAGLMHGHTEWSGLAALAGWGLLATAAAVRWFSWD